MVGVFGACARRARQHGIVGLVAAALTGCAGLSAFVSPEGNPTFGPRHAATGAPGEGRFTDQREDDEHPQRHVALTAFDPWRPAPIGVVLPGTLPERSRPIVLTAGPLTVELRAADRLVPAWGGDTYVRVDLRARGRAEHAPSRDIVVVADVHADANALARVRRIASGLFATLRPGDRGALVATSSWGTVLVPLLPHGAAPVLVDRADRLEALGADDLASAMQHAEQMLAGHDDSRTRKIVVLSASGDVVSGEALNWMRVALGDGVEVSLVPLAAPAAHRFEQLSLRETSLTALPLVRLSDHDEADAIEELAALPPAETAASEVALVVESLPGPSHVFDAAGATVLWAPWGSEVPLGAVREGDARTFVLRASVPSWRSGEPFELGIAVRWVDATGPHETRAMLRARYASAQSAWQASRAGDVVEYASLLNTLADVEGAVARRDEHALATLRVEGQLQARSMVDAARAAHDPVMDEQARLLLALLGTAAR